jgi:hypothetical protein
VTVHETSRLIIPGGSGDPREQARRNPYAESSSDHTPISYTGPKLYSSKFVNTASRGPIRRTASAIGGNTGTGGLSGQSVAQSPLYYDYRWSTPDKFYFPRNRVVANSIWREIYKRDAAVATATDMYAEMPWSEFDLMGIDDKHVKHVYEDMFSELNIVSKLPMFTKDFLITGELILHNVFDSVKGIWNRTIPHNPDFIKAEGVGLALDQPLLWLLPTPEIKRLINSTDPRVRRLQKVLPRELINAFRNNKEVALDALNTTFIPRLNSSTDLRGTSLYTRLFRIIMYEDFIVNASLAVAQRNAAPLRIFKLGDPNSGWLPDEEDEAAFAEMLSMAESDPLAAIIMHHNVTAELVGVSDRVLLISREWDFIERVKLLGLGVAKSFLVGETSFASSVAGLQTLMQRLHALRLKFEYTWILQKVCKPISQIHEFYRRTPAELDHRIRVKRPLDQEELIIPKIKWKKSLEATQDVAILNIWRDLKERGILSERTYGSGAGVNIDAERKNIVEERTYKEDHPEIYGVPQQQPGQQKPPVPPKTPAVPGASSKNEYRLDNPYISKRAATDIEDRLHDLADTENKIDVRDVIEVLEDADDMQHDTAREEGALAYLPVATTDLLSGS